MKGDRPRAAQSSIRTPPAVNNPEKYDAIGSYIAEIYDRTESQRDDVALILGLIGDHEKRVLEPFCGHGRILIPLAEAGHTVEGLDFSACLLRSLENRLRLLPARVRSRASFRRSDVIADEWPGGFDVVLLGANCLYELATPDEQELCVRTAARALVSGGHLFMDSDHMEGSLDPSWRRPGVRHGVFPTGTCADGTEIRGTTETIWYNAAQRLARFRRTVTVVTTDGRTHESEWLEQCHPPSTDEMSGWLQKHGFVIEQLWGSRHREAYNHDSDRAIFWARRQ